MYTHKLWIHTIKWFAIVCAIVLILFAASINIARILTPYLNHQRATLLHWTSRILARDVNFRAFKIQWQGLDPILHWRGVAITNPLTHEILNIDSLTIGISAFYSLLNARLLPSAVSINGVVLNIRQDQLGKITIDGFSSSSQSMQWSHNALLHWILTQSNVLLRNVSINFHGKNTQNYILRGVRLRLNNSLLQHRIIGSAEIEQQYPARVNFALHLYHQNDHDFSADLLVKSVNLDARQWVLKKLLHQYFPHSNFVQGTLDAQLKLSWRRQHLIAMKTQLIGNQAQFLIKQNHRKSQFGIDQFIMKSDINFHKQKGHLDFDSKKIVIMQPQVARPLYFNLLKTQLDWQLNKKQFNISNAHFLLQDNHLNLKGQYNFVRPKVGDNILDVDAIFSFNNLKYLKNYLPATALSPGLIHWFHHAFLAGVLQNGVMHFHGPLNLATTHNIRTHFNASMQVENAVLHYAPQWPNFQRVNAQVEIQDHRLLIHASHAQVMNNELTNVQGMIADLGNPLLNISGQSTGALTNQLKFLQAMPMTFVRPMKNWQATGEASTAINLQIQLNKPKYPTLAEGTVSLSSNTLYFPAWNQQLNALHGDINFNNENLSSKKLSAEILNSPVKINLFTVENKKHKPTFVMTVGGKVTVAGLQQRMTLPWINDWHGATYYRALLTLPGDQLQAAPTLTLVSDLRGIASAFPAPFHKTANEQKHFWMKFGRGKMRLRYGDYFSAAARFNEASPSVHIHLGDAMASDPTHAGIFIDGALETFDWQAWRKFFNIARARGLNQNVTTPLEISLLIKKFHLGGYQFNKINFNLESRAQYLDILLQSPDISGDLQIPFAQNGIWAGHFQHLAFGAIAMNAIAFQFLPTDAGVEIKRLLINDDLFYFDASGLWDRRTSKTNLAGKMVSSNLGRLLRRWGITQALVGGNGAAYFNLYWPGLLPDLSAKNLNGSLKLNFKIGRIIHLSKEMDNKIGLGRILNLLSLQSFPQNLVTGLFTFSKKGFNFSELQGDIRLQTGLAEIMNGSLVGPVAWVDLNGIIGMLDKSYNLTVRIKPNMTSSIPLIVGLTGGPLAGAITWIANRVIAAPIIGKAAESTYHITGSWDVPAVKQRRHA